jgi:hypothetical protein
MTTYPSVAVMTPLPPRFDEITKNTLLSSWQSIYKQTYPTEALHFYFSVREELLFDYHKFLIENFKLSCTLLPGSTHVEDPTQLGKAKFLELTEHRNLLLQNGKKHDWGFFVDSDILIPPQTIKRFIENNLEIVGGVVVVPTLGCLPNGEFVDAAGPGFGSFYYKNGLLQGSELAAVMPQNISKVDFVNTACMFLSHKVMNDSRVKFCIVPTAGDFGFLGEDHSYCYVAAKNGYAVMIDPDIRCNHLRIWRGILWEMSAAGPNLWCRL